MKEPLVSVVMSVYSEPVSWLTESIDSILGQTLSDFEFIIINDNPKSIDIRKTLKKFENLDDRVKYIENEENIGLTKSLNRGLSIARGKYIARMDADDISLPNRLLQQSHFLERNTRVFLVDAAIIRIDNSGNEIGRSMSPIFHALIKWRLRTKNCLCHPTIMFKNEGRRYNEDYRFAQDYDFYRSVIAEGKIMAGISDFLLKYRSSETQVSISKKKEQRECFLKIREYYNSL